MTTQDDFDRARMLFEQVLDRAPDERSPFLAGACDGDNTLQHEVESLLRAHDEAGDDPAPPSPGEQPGDRIDRYKLLQVVGEGGFGTVWMAEQIEPVRRKVALKIIKLGMDPCWRGRMSCRLTPPSHDPAAFYKNQSLRSAAGASSGTSTLASINDSSHQLVPL